MTLGNYVLSLRNRIQDIFTYAGVKITSANTDGIRWTSSELVEICNSSISELVRLISLYKDNPRISELIQNLVALSSNSEITNGAKELDETVGIVLSVRKTDGSFYAKISPDLYTQYASADKSPRENEYFFTVLLNPSSGKREIKILPANSADRITYSFIYKKANYTSSDLNTDIYLQGFDDLLLDIAERECRDREKNWDRSNILTTRIIQKLGGSSNE